MRIPPSVIAAPLYGIVKLFYATLRFSDEGRDRIEALAADRRPMVFALWHDELFPLAHVRGNIDITALVSQSRDGEILARFLEMTGAQTARGSSSRGGVKALLKVSRAMRTRGGSCAITVDGPRGPRHKVKEGAIFMAAKAGAHVVPMRVFMPRGYRFASWDRFQVPYPFSRVHTIFDEPYLLPDEELDNAFLARQSALLEERLNTITFTG